MLTYRGQNLAQERKNLAFTLKDTKSVVAHVESMLGVFLHTLFAFAYLYIFEVCASAESLSKQPLESWSTDALYSCQFTTWVCVKALLFTGLCQFPNFYHMIMLHSVRFWLDPSILLETEPLTLCLGLGWHSHSRESAVQVDVTKAWMTFSSCLLAFVFVFGNNIRSIYEACLKPLPLATHDAHRAMAFVGDTALGGTRSPRNYVSKCT